MIKKILLTVLLVSMLSGTLFADAEIVTGKEVTNDIAHIPPKTTGPRIQMAILLDTSGSMSGLIDQARAELWAVVNEFITVKQNGKVPQLDVALYEYGKSSLPGSEGYIRQIVGFTNDLDKVSQELFALKTNGGSEYCGWVIKDAVTELTWSPAKNDLKVIFIAGNEPFTQGPVHYKESCKSAIEKGIIVNTIHCGSMQEGINGKWKDGAVIADGSYLCINHNKVTPHIAAPQDAEIVKLNSELNGTYIAYGVEGAKYKEIQAAQDSNSRRLSTSVLSSRAASKSSAYYRNDKWDVVDAVKDGKKITDFKESELPEEMRKMNEKERKAYVEKMAKKRKEIQAKIQELNEARKKYIAAEMKKLNNAEESLGEAMIKSVKIQAESRNFKFEKPKGK